MIKEDTKLISEFYELKVKQLIDKKIWDLPIIEKTVPISYILSILDGKSHVWIVNNIEEKELVGIITRHDVLYTLAPPRKYYAFFTVPESCCHYGTSGQAEDIMKRDPITCEKDEKIVDVLQKMIRHRVRRLAVVENNKIVGEITLKYLIHKFYMASQYHPIVDENIKLTIVSDLLEFIKKEKINIELSKDSNTNFWLDTPDKSITVRFIIDIKSKEIYYDVYSTEYEKHLKEKTLKDVEKLEFIAEEHRKWKIAEFIEDIWLILDEVEIWAQKNDFKIKEKELI
jgi:CBS domain-containing protein